MDNRMREALRKSRIYLIDNVIVDDLMDHLIDQDIFSDTMLDYIKAGTERIEKIRRLLDYLIRRPNSCYFKFLTALVNSSHEHCARCIQQNYVQSGPTQVSEAVANTPTPQLSCAAGLPDEDVPMENAACVSQEKAFQCLGFPGETAALGFPEVSSSMNAFAGSFISVPVQESSMAAGEITPSPSSGGPSCEQSAGRMNGVEINVPASLPSGFSDTSLQLSQLSNGHITQSVYQRHRLSHPEAVYRMDSRPRGLALVINNEHFTSLSRRIGSQRDMENLHILFKKLGFNVCHEKDKTAEEIRALLKSFTEYKPLQEVDALVVVILSHGGRDGIIFGREGSHGKGCAQDYITDEKIRDMFSARNCPMMAQKPKLIIIQACRGVNEDVADGVRSRFSPRGNNNNNHSSNNKTDCSLGNDGPSVDSNFSRGSSARTANMADICLIHSTVQGYVSYRHPVEGSPFIQEMTHVFQEHADREHLNDLMTMVNQKLASRPLPEDLRTVPSTTNTLTKKWFLNPPSSC